MPTTTVMMATTATFTAFSAFTIFTTIGDHLTLYHYLLTKILLYYLSIILAHFCSFYINMIASDRSVLLNGSCLNVE